MIASVLLNSQREITHGDIRHQGNWPVGAHLGHRDGEDLVAVHAGVAVDRDPIILASLGHNLEVPLWKNNLYWKAWVISGVQLRQT